MSKKDFERRNSKFGTISIVEIGFHMSIYDIWPQFEYQISIRFSASVLMSK